MPSQTDHFAYTACGLPPSERRRQRLFEILPGACSWGLMLGLVALSWWHPVAAIVCIIAFDLWWLLFMVYVFVLIAASAIRLRIDRSSRWMARLEELSGPPGDGARESPPSAAPSNSGSNKNDDRPSPFRRLSRAIHRRELLKIRALDPPPPDASAIHHVVIISITDEDRTTIQRSVDSMLGQDFPIDRVLLILAVHENASRSVKEIAWKLHRQHFEEFCAFYVAPHPAGADPSRRVKSAAANYAARMAAEVIEKKQIDPANVVLSCLEPNAVPEPGYLACLTWQFLACPHRHRACFQPIPVYHESVWAAPGFASIVHIGSSFFLRVVATRPDELVSFASYGMSLKALLEVGYWPDDEHLADDSAFFWKAYLHYDGDFQVVPIYTTLAMDIVRTHSFAHTVAQVYRRKLDEASAILNLPIIYRGFLKKSTIPLLTRLRHAGKMLVEHVGAATWVFLLLIVGWLPGLAASHREADSALSFFAPRFHAVIFCLAFIGLAAAALMSALQLPRRTPEVPLRRVFGHAVAWLLFPLLALFLTACPALETQTRLMLGRHRKKADTGKQPEKSPL